MQDKPTKMHSTPVKQIPIVPNNNGYPNNVPNT
jgi:hypothetical protein